ncbi:hypothetical protein CFC35_05810 [Streptomyces sp. FBKL.4005]|uniref:hypothetical protein n=1 Tax=Streptomyces sp. FBKL.4005 TaxID=2015515 RepID=UPI000B95CDC3|nr:hypothetical protein [Streptomyces sp. FBKL.4005]OYP14080.1 hypothetical protein CFC35_05810 [Streptomyces sp. FBKL.4005]
MGYRKTQRRIEVSLKGHKTYGDDTDYPLAYARGKSLGEYLVLMGYSDAEEGDERSGVVRQLEEFADALVSWNLEREDGTPIPCTRQALFGEVDNDLALALATEWIERLGGKVDSADPLPSSSPSGEPSPVASIPMEALSDPQPSTSVPA